ncbi:ABI gene family member 3 isoform X2 [Ornithorhynchus anatinus]|uniref:ABI gene family member 3 isoform X2 n=1 Tax=Ornithorhynchus anatinus TaxID=9258 RepID=UPI0010A86225|nr:ABI gene family member 3 isoform X2 [Ornithorhynchus anatinus]
MAELQRLREQEIPAAQKALKDNEHSLLRVADYCENNYLQVEDKRKALEETMAFTTQSLASVAYQISHLAGQLLRLLDLQTTGLRQVEADVCTLSQTVAMHIEKVARRDIGTLATVQRPASHKKIAYPENLPTRGPYYRKPINFGSLDHIGHGIKDLSTRLSRTGTLSRKSGKAGAAPGSGTLGRAARVPEPVQLPVVPEGKLSAASSPFPLTSGSVEGACGGPSAKGITDPPSPPFLPPAPPSDCNFLPPPVPEVLEQLPPPPPPPGDPTSPTPAAFIPPPPPLPPPLPELGLPLPLDLLPPPEPESLDLPPPPPPSFDPEETAWEPDQYLEKVVTLYPYTRQKDNELSFDPGTVICVTRRYSDGWCEGVTAEAAGFFPGNYVEPC